VGPPSLRRKCRSYSELIYISLQFRTYLHDHQIKENICLAYWDYPTSKLKYFSGTNFYWLSQAFWQRSYALIGQRLLTFHPVRICYVPEFTLIRLISTLLRLHNKRSVARMTRDIRSDCTQLLVLSKPKWIRICYSLMTSVLSVIHIPP